MIFTAQILMVTQTKSANSAILSNTNQLQHLVFIDSQVSDYSYLATGVIPGAEVIVLEPERDGIKQITKALNSYSFSYPVSLHIVSHGSPGCLYLGNSELSLDTLDNYKQDLKTWFPPSPDTFHTPYSLLPSTDKACLVCTDSPLPTHHSLLPTPFQVYVFNKVENLNSS